MSASHSGASTPARRSRQPSVSGANATVSGVFGFDEEKKQPSTASANGAPPVTSAPSSQHASPGVSKTETKKTTEKESDNRPDSTADKVSAERIIALVEKLREKFSLDRYDSCDIVSDENWPILLSYLEERLYFGQDSRLCMEVLSLLCNLCVFDSARNLMDRNHVMETLVTALVGFGSVRSLLHLCLYAIANAALGKEIELSETAVKSIVESVSWGFEDYVVCYAWCTAIGNLAAISPVVFSSLVRNNALVQLQRVLLYHANGSQLVKRGMQVLVLLSGWHNCQAAAQFDRSNTQLSIGSPPISPR